MAQGLQSLVHLSFDLLHYTYDLQGHAGLHSHSSVAQVSQPCLLADWYRLMFGVELSSKVSIDVVEVVSINVVEVVSIDDVRFSLRIERSKRVGSEKKSNSSLLLLVLIGMYPKDKNFFM